MSVFLGADVSKITGTGTINMHNIIVDGFDLVFDANHGFQQSIKINQQPGQNLTLNLTYPSMSSVGAGYSSGGTIAIRDGFELNTHFGHVGVNESSSGVVTIAGDQSAWITEFLLVGHGGHGTINITDGGFLSADWLSLYSNDHLEDSYAHINLANGGMLMLRGRGDASLTDFYELIYPDHNHWSDSLRYWDPRLDTWTGLTHATEGVDYTLEFITEGYFTGSTLLTVNVVPEPQTTAVLCLGLAACLRRRTGF